MTRESLAFGLSGVFFGVLIGWIVGSQQAAVAPAPAAPAVTSQQDTSAPGSASAADQPQPLDAARATSLERQASAEPSNVAVRVELGNMYFDAERDAEAATWYEAALKLRPNSPDVSTDLGIAYFRMQQVDRALEQFKRSLAIDPKHLKTLLNQGMVLALGKQDLGGAVASWERVVALAPNSEEARRAQMGLEGIRAAHPEVGATSPAGGR